MPFIVKRLQEVPEHPGQRVWAKVSGTEHATLAEAMVEAGGTGPDFYQVVEVDADGTERVVENVHPDDEDMNPGSAA